MTPRPRGLPPWVNHEADEPPIPGQRQLVLAGLAVGILMVGIQLWLLTVALELLLGGHGETVWICAAISGVVFAGGLLMQWVLMRRPQVHRLTTDESGRIVRRYDHPHDVPK